MNWFLSQNLQTVFAGQRVEAANQSGRSTNHHSFISRYVAKNYYIANSRLCLDRLRVPTCEDRGERECSFHGDMVAAA
jgi:hypothetical protein